MEKRQGLESDDSDCEEENQAQESGEKPSFVENLDLVSLVQVEVKLGQKPVLLEEKDQTQTLLVKVTEGSLDEERIEQASLDVVCLIDCSGSMNGFKLTQVKQTLLYVMELLKPHDRMAIVTFNSETQVQNSLRLATKENKCGRLLSNIQGLTAFGGTNIVGGLKKALKILAKRKTKNNICSVFLLSDGNDNYGLEGLDGLLEKSAIANLSINTFGYGEDHDPESLRKIAQARKGNFYYIKDLARVDEAFVDCLALLTSVIGGQAEATIRLIPTPLFKEINFRTCYGSQWRGDQDTCRTIDIGSLYVGMEKAFVAEISLDANLAAGFAGREIKIAEVEFNLKSISLKNQKSASIVKDLVVSVQQSTPDARVEKDEEVERHYLRVTGAQVLNAAKEFISKGKEEDAKKILDGFKAKIGHIKVKDVVLDNLNQQIDYGQRYIGAAPMQPSLSLSKPSFSKVDRKREEERRDISHYLNQNAHAMMNLQSAPEWNSSLFQNKRQKRFLTEHIAKYK